MWVCSSAAAVRQSALRHRHYRTIISDGLEPLRHRSLPVDRRRGVLAEEPLPHLHAMAKPMASIIAKIVHQAKAETMLRQRANSKKKRRLKFWAAAPRGPFPMPPHLHTLLQRHRLPPIQLQIYNKLPIDTPNKHNNRSANPLAPETQTTTPLAAPPPLPLLREANRC